MATDPTRIEAIRARLGAATSDQLAFNTAIDQNADRWVPANGGTETVFISRSGVRMLYCYNPKLQKHAYLNVDSDIIIPDDEVGNFLLTF